MVNGWSISCETALIWVSLGHTYDKSTLVQVMALCHQGTNHYLSQCWPISLSSYGVTRPQWVNSFFGNNAYSTLQELCIKLCFYCSYASLMIKSNTYEFDTEIHKHHSDSVGKHQVQKWYYINYKQNKFIKVSSMCHNSMNAKTFEANLTIGDSHIINSLRKLLHLSHVMILHNPYYVLFHISAGKIFS